MPYRYTLSLRAPMKTPFLNHIMLCRMIRVVSRLADHI
jgi:hypothetical protein